MKYLLLATLFAGLVLLPGSATRAEDTLPIPELSSRKRMASLASQAIIQSTRQWISSRTFCDLNKSPCLRSSTTAEKRQRWD